MIGAYLASTILRPVPDSSVADGGWVQAILSIYGEIFDISPVNFRKRK